MMSLRARNKKSVPSSQSKSKKKAPVRFLDLDNYDDGSGDDDEGPDEIMAKEKRQLELLDKQLTGCMRCSSEKYCKIDKSGNHIHLTFQQRRGWANALVQLS